MSIDFDAAAIEQLRRHSYLPASEVARLGGTSEQGLAPGWMALLEQALPLAADRAQPPVSKRAPGQPKPGRNDPCPCGSGVKYKKCCAPAFD